MDSMISRRDLLAYLRERERAAEALAARDPRHADVLRDRARQLGVMIHDIETGMVDGAAAFSPRPLDPVQVEGTEDGL